MVVCLCFIDIAIIMFMVLLINFRILLCLAVQVYQNKTLNLLLKLELCYLPIETTICGENVKNQRV